MEKDKRAYPRFLVTSDASVIYGEGTGSILDLSVGGCFVADPSPFPVGMKVDIELRLGEQAIPAQGVVRRSVPGRGMGLQFLGMPPAVRGRLKMFLLEQVGDRARILMPPE